MSILQKTLQSRQLDCWRFNNILIDTFKLWNSEHLNRCIFLVNLSYVVQDVSESSQI